MNQANVNEVNQYITCKLVMRYLTYPTQDKVWSVADACITVRRSGRRFGVPADATSWRYLIKHPELGWSYAVRAVWRNQKLFEPVAVHTVIEEYFADEEELVPDENVAALCINDWLCSLPL